MSVIIKDMDMPIDCLACRIACDKENYGVISRPQKCPLAEAPVGDLINRAEAIEAIFKVGHEHVEEKVIPLGAVTDYSDAIKALPSADAVSREDYHNLLTASEDIDRALREYQAKEEQLSAEIEPKIDHDRDWIIGCIEHDGFIHTHRFDKANQIIRDALSAGSEWIPCSERLPEYSGTLCIVTIEGEDGARASLSYWQGNTHKWSDLGHYYKVTAWMPLPKPYREDGEA